MTSHHQFVGFINIEAYYGVPSNLISCGKYGTLDASMEKIKILLIFTSRKTIMDKRSCKKNPWGIETHDLKIKSRQSYLTHIHVCY